MKFKTGLFIFAACILQVRTDDNSKSTAADTATKYDDSGASSSSTVFIDDVTSTAANATPSSCDDKAAVTTEPTAETALKESTEEVAIAASSSDAKHDLTTSSAAASAAAESSKAATTATATTATVTIATTNLPYNSSAKPIGFVHENRIICICQLDYDPVCGSNGVTYSNECVLNCVSNDQITNKYPAIRRLYRGECRTTPCNCHKAEQPVCGTNNNTYVNDCYLSCDNAHRAQAGHTPIAIAYTGVCKQTTCRCPDSIIPLCGTDNRTYRNICVLQCYSRFNQGKGLPAIYARSPGACKKEVCNCPLKKNQLCASDDNTYYNQCVLVCQNRRRSHLGLDPLTVQYPGKCIKCICTLDKDPVCASDGKTYSNHCVLLCENEKRRRMRIPDLKVHWQGPCNCGCTWEWNPVCASDQKTWANRCLLECENATRLLHGLLPLTELYDGDCKECNCDFCPKHYKPVCGSDNQTYENLCFLKCISACNTNCGVPPITKIADTECKNNGLQC